MNKILSGFVGLLSLLVIVSVSAYALFTTQVTVTGGVLGTGTAGLEIAANFNGDWTPQAASLDLNEAYIANALYPGQSDWGHVKLINESDPGVDMNLQARLTSAGGDWGVLKDVLEMRVREYTGDGVTDTFGGSTPWMNLSDWNSADRNLPGNPLLANDEQEYWIEVRLPASADDSVKGKTITDIAFEITGTQAN